jgi:hypothetical protein
VREQLGSSAELKLLFGISFGVPDKTPASYEHRIGRESLETLVTFH